MHFVSTVQFVSGTFLFCLYCVISQTVLVKLNETPWLWSASELYRPSDRRLAKLVPTFAEEGVAWSAQRIPTVVNLGLLP
jgi:hypothetical protein